MAFTQYNYGSGLDRNPSELKVLLVGSVQSGKSSAGNTILGIDTFGLNRTPKCVMRRGTAAGRKITVVEAPGWWNDSPVEESTTLLNREIVLSMSPCPPGPHAVLLVIRLDVNFTDFDKRVSEGHVNLLGDKVWSHTIVLFTFGDSLGNNTIEQHVGNQSSALRRLVEKCDNRFQAFVNKNGSDVQITKLLEKIEKMVEGNRGHRFEPDLKNFRELEGERREVERRSRERRTKVSKQREDLRKLMRPTHHYAQINILLLGCRNAGKSSAGNIILRGERFNLNRAVECEKREGNAADRKITVVEVPGWHSDRPVEECTELLKQEIVLSVTQCLPGPHAILAVVNGDQSFQQNDKEILAGYLMLLGDKIWRHTIVLFTFRDALGDVTVEQHIESEGEALQGLVEKCGNRYHVFNLPKTNDDFQVEELLEKIEEMMAGNQSSHLEMDTKILLTKEARKREELDKSMERMAWVLKHGEGIPSHMSGLHRFSELRIVLLGCRNSGKSSTGNTILGLDASEFNPSESNKCVRRQGNVSGMKLTVVEAPGWSSDRPVEESSGSLKREFALSVSACPPGPYAVLVVVNGDRIFTQEDLVILTGYVDLLGDKIWRHAIVLFTFGDSLGDTTIERHIESEGEALWGLVEKCGNRYHVFNNKKTDEGQVRELLEKIEAMLAGNRCRHFEKDTESFQEMEERFVERFLKQLKERNDYKNMGTKMTDTETREDTVTKGSLSNLHSLPTFQKHVGTEETSTKSDVKGANFVDQHLEVLVQRVSSVNEIADRLKGKNMITKEMYYEILAARTTQDKMRELYKHLNSTEIKAEFYQVLKTKQLSLVRELESKHLKEGNMPH